MDVHRLTDAIRQPEYTGENRCPPCTVVNVVLAGLLSGAVATLSVPLGVAAFLGSLALIYLRGYLVPGTPALTKRSLPDRVLARFDKDEYAELAAEAERAAADERADPGKQTVADSDEQTGADPGEQTGADPGEQTGADPGEQAATDERADSGERAAADERATGTSGAGHAPATDGAGVSGAASVVAPGPDGDVEPPDIEDQESFLRGAGALEDVPDPAIDDLQLVPGFRDEWFDRADAISDPDDTEAAFADLLGVDTDRLVVISHGAALVVNLDGSLIGKWESREAFVADVAADQLLAERVPGWTGLPAERRSEVVRGLRAFLEACPGCGGRVELSQETVESCCRSKEVLAATCQGCGARMLEVEAPRST